jgi:hypothetical protein
MSNLINPKPRFGFNPMTGLLYDYVAQRDLAVTDKVYDAVDGTWNLVAVRDAILANQPIEGAHLTIKKVAPFRPNSGPARTPAPGPAAAPTTLVAKPDQPTTTDANKRPVTGLSAEQLNGLKLTAIQVAVLGITPTQLTATGVPPAQVESWRINEARADALKLTPEQRAVLLP